MSRQNKQRSKKAQSSKFKGSNAGKHRGEGVKISHFPGDQNAASWMKPSGRKGYWNTPKPKDPNVKAKPVVPRPAGQIAHF